MGWWWRMCAGATCMHVLTGEWAASACHAVVMHSGAAGALCMQTRSQCRAGAGHHAGCVVSTLVLMIDCGQVEAYIVCGLCIVTECGRHTGGTT